MAETKTVIEIDDDLLAAVRERSKRADQPVEELVAEALRYYAGSLARSTDLAPISDADVLTALRRQAAQAGRPESEVTDEVVRRYRDDLQALDEVTRELQAGRDMDDEEALRLAYEELDALRAERAAG